MRRSCEERRRRVTEMNAEPQCADIFFKCCIRGEALRKSAAEDNGFGRSKHVRKKSYQPKDHSTYVID
jgi:hypothetical protein